MVKIGDNYRVYARKKKSEGYNLKDEVAKSRFKVMIWGALATMAMVSGLHIGQYEGT